MITLSRILQIVLIFNTYRSSLGEGNTCIMFFLRVIFVSFRCIFINLIRSTLEFLINYLFFVFRDSCWPCTSIALHNVNYLNITLKGTYCFDFAWYFKVPAFKDAIAVGTLSPEVFHASGLAASQQHDGILYTHNDGDDPQRRSPIVFAINASSGALIARLMVYPATNEDWEDIAVGPCGNTSCIYISDKAANIIYRVAEPEFVYSDQILSVDSKVGIE